MVEDDVGRNHSGAQRGAEVPLLESSSQREPSSALTALSRQKEIGPFGLDATSSAQTLLSWVGKTSTEPSDQSETCSPPAVSANPDRHRAVELSGGSFNDLHRVQAQQSAGCLPPSSGRDDNLHQGFDKRTPGQKGVVGGSVIPQIGH